MPLKLYDASEQEFLDYVLSSEAPASAMRLEYHVGEHVFSESPLEDEPVIEAEWGRTDDDRPAQELTLRIKESINPEEIRNASAYVFLNVGDLRIRQFSGQVLGVTPGRVRTEIRAVTGGYWLDKVRRGETVSYANVSCREVVADCVSRLDRYDLRRMDLGEDAGPKLKRQDSTLFQINASLADPIAAAVDEGDRFFTDSPYNAPLLTKDRGPAEATEVLHEYVVGEDIDPLEFEPELASDEFYAVVAYREVNGIVEELFDPILVPGSNAPVGAMYEVEVTDESLTAGEDAYHLGIQVANRVALGQATVNFSVRWIHPLLMDGDFISIVEPFVEGGRSGVRRWVAKVIRQRKTHDLRQLFESVEMVRVGTTYDTLREVKGLSSRGHVFP